MNIYICIAKIVQQPKLLRFKGTALSQILIIRPNNKKGKPLYIIRAIAKGKMAKTIFENYKQNDSIIVEGFIYLKRVSIKSKYKKNKYKLKKYINMKIQKIHLISI